MSVGEADWRTKESVSVELVWRQVKPITTNWHRFLREGKLLFRVSLVQLFEKVHNEKSGVL